MRVALGDRSGFPQLAYRAYLAHSAIAPPSTAVAAAMGEVIEAYARSGIGAIMPYLERREALRGELGELIGARGADIGFVANTTAGLNVVANGVRWRAGDRVVVFRGEFPTNVFPWRQAAAREGLELCWLDAEDFRGPAGDGLAKLEAMLAEGVRLVAVSAVQFHTGLRMPVREMGAMCRRHGAELCVDAIQAAGVCPLDVDWGIDYLACGGHKWLGGVEGAAFVYLHPDKVADLQPNLAGWLSLEQPIDFLMGPGELRYDREVRPEASMVEGGVQSVVGLAALQASVQALRTLGIAPIYAHVQRYLDELEPGLVELGFASHRSGVDEQRSAIASFDLPARVAKHTDVATFAERLDARGVKVTTPDGLLRFAPHWSNPLAEVPAVLEAVAAAVEGPS